MLDESPVERQHGNLRVFQLGELKNAASPFDILFEAIDVQFSVVKQRTEFRCRVRQRTIFPERVQQVTLAEASGQIFSVGIDFQSSGAPQREGGVTAVTDDVDKTLKPSGMFEGAYFGQGLPESLFRYLEIRPGPNGPRVIDE